MQSASMPDRTAARQGRDGRPGVARRRTDLDRVILPSNGGPRIAETTDPAPQCGAFLFNPSGRMDFDLTVFSDQSVRLAFAVVLGGVIGAERELSGQWAGVRTHMMVSLGAAIFAVVAKPFCEESPAEITRVIQGIAAGIGFLGAGTILKLDDKRQVIGLTTAASIWLAAAVGTAVGLSQLSLAVAATAMAIVVLVLLLPLRWLLSKLGRDEPQERNQAEEG